jgi:transcriptional regulator with XRE-family HTH domain
MPFTPGPEVNPLFVRARMALGLTQKELGERLGASVRTANRWEGGQAHPDLRQIAELARAVFPKDAALAEGLARECGTTLVDLGLTTAPSAAAAPPARAFPPVGLVIDSVLLAAIDAAARHDEPSLSERAIIVGVLRAAFARARGLGLTLAEVDDALSARAAVQEAPAEAEASARPLRRRR